MTLPACDRIIELSEKATEGLWVSHRADGARAKVEAVYNDEKGRMRSNGYVASYAWSDDADFIAESRTLAPKIAAALNEAVRAIEEAPHSTACWWRNHECLSWNDVSADRYNCTCWKQTALARITELLK